MKRRLDRFKEREAGKKAAPSGSRQAAPFGKTAKKRLNRMIESGFNPSSIEDAFDRHDRRTTNGES